RRNDGGRDIRSVYVQKLIQIHQAARQFGHRSRARAETLCLTLEELNRGTLLRCGGLTKQYTLPGGLRRLYLGRKNARLVLHESAVEESQRLRRRGAFVPPRTRKNTVWRIEGLKHGLLEGAARQQVNTSSVMLLHVVAYDPGILRFANQSKEFLSLQWWHHRHSTI